jgi:flagellar biosynthetic protein FlhB
MADDQEKTEEPTPKKIEDARKEGNVPKSQDASSFITLVVAIGAFLALLPYMKEKMFSLYRFTQSYIGVDLDKNDVYILSFTIFREFAIMILPLATIVAISGIIAGLLQFGFLITTKTLIPDLKKIDPIKGLKNLFSMKKFIEGLKIVLKVTLVMILAYYILLSFTKELTSIVFFPIYDLMQWLMDKALILIAAMLVLFLALALFDLLFVRYNYFKELRMSKQEVKDEYKQMEGDPLVKARIKRVQMEMSKKRMMQDIPSADVVITNPTHFAVAIRYDTKKESAPKVVAKGVDHLALKIKEIAREHRVQIIENPPLARELYKRCEIDEMIPQTMYKAVAEVLAFVYKSSKKSRI